MAEQAGAESGTSKSASQKAAGKASAGIGFLRKAIKPSNDASKTTPRTFSVDRPGVPSFDALKNASVILMIVGFLHWGIRWMTGGFTTINYGISLALFFAAGYAISNKFEKDRLAVFAPMIGYIVWYFFFGGNTDKTFLLYFGIGFVVILALIGIFTKGKAVQPELFGFVPIVFFFLDVGLVPWLLNNFNLQVSSEFNSMVLIMPWWALLGFLLLPKEEGEKRNPVVTILKFAGLLYMLFVIVMPIMPDVAYESAVPTIGELEEAQAQLREQVPKTENPGWSNFICTIQAIQNVADIGGFSVDDCVAERQLNSQVKYTCREDYGFTEGSADYNRCIEDEKVRIEEEKTEIVQGTVDRSILEKTEAKFKIDHKTFPENRLVSAGTTQGLQYPINLEIQNPREQLLGVSLSCNFTKTGSSESFAGEILPNSEFDFIDRADTVTRTCTPPAGRILNGSYSLTYQAEFSNLQTTSYLTRMFLEDYDEDDELIQEAVRTYFFGSKSLSSAPEEFARINFGFGEPETNPVIEKDDAILLVSSIENVGSGEITHVNSYSIELEPYVYPAAYQQNEFTCLYGDEQIFYGESFGRIASTPLSICFLELSSETLNLIENQEFVVRSFEANLFYNYQIKTQKSITVTIV